MGRVSKGWLEICEGWIGCSGMAQAIRCGCIMNSQVRVLFCVISLTDATTIRDTPCAVALAIRWLRENVCRTIDWSSVDATISEDSSA